MAREDKRVFLPHVAKTGRPEIRVDGALCPDMGPTLLSCSENWLVSLALIAAVALCSLSLIETIPPCLD